MASRRDQERIRALLTEAITVLCKNGLGYNYEFCIDGLLGITVDNEDIFLVKINEKISREKRSIHLSLDPSHERYADHSSVTSASPDQSSSLSQPPTPLTVNSHQRIEYQRSESLESSPRKRHWDNHSPEPEPPVKRIQGNSESNHVTVKEEVVNNGEVHYVVPGEQNGEVSTLAPTAGSKQGSSVWAQAAAAAHLSSNLQIYEDSQLDRGQSNKSPIRSIHNEPLDFTLTEEKRILQSFNLTATAEATKAALLQHQKALLRAMSAAAVNSTQHQQHQSQQQQSQQQQQVWQHMNPEYLRLQHKLSRPYVCEECGKTFTSSCGRRRHMDTHQGIYPYRCEHCGKGFTASNNLKAHLTLHTNINNFKCDICGHAFRYSQYLKDHIRKEHAEPMSINAVTSFNNHA